MSIRSYLRYYFVRKKAPLSSILWHDILKRDFSSWGVFNTSIATDDDAALNFHMGAPGENYITINLYDANGKWFDHVDIHLSYRAMKKVRAKWTEAFRISREKIREENAQEKANQRSN